MNDANMAASQAALTGITNPVFKYSIHKSYVNHQVSYTDEVEPRKLYTYQEPAHLLTWKINPTTTSFGGYKCQEATTLFRGRKYTALFTREIPIPDGPYKFSGLPGLIVRIADSHGDYTFELVRLREVENMPEPNIPAKTVQTNRAGYNKAYQDLQINYIDRAAEFGVTLSDPVAAKANWREKVKRRNNPLEKLGY